MSVFSSIRSAIWQETRPIFDRGGLQAEARSLITTAAGLEVFNRAMPGRVSRILLDAGMILDGVMQGTVGTVIIAGLGTAALSKTGYMSHDNTTLLTLGAFSVVAGFRCGIDSVLTSRGWNREPRAQGLAAHIAFHEHPDRGAQPTRELLELCRCVA